MVPENPAVRVYNYWRMMMEYQGRAHLLDAQDRLTTFANSLKQSKPSQPWDEARSDIEQYMLQVQNSHYGAPHVMLDYRIGLRIVGMSDRHVADDNPLWDSMDDWQPVIQLALRIRYNRNVPIMTLWPNGDFRLDAVPAEGMYQIFPRWTFFRTSWAVSSRAWFPEQPGMKPYRSGWVNIDEKDFHAAVPFVGRHTFKRGASYRLVWDGRYWRFASQYGCPDGNYDLNLDAQARDRLKYEYDRCEKRYERYRRAAISGNTSEARIRKVAMYVPKHGRMTGMEAVQQFTQHMRVYAPVEAQEATHGNDGLVASTVHQ